MARNDLIDERVHTGPPRDGVRRLFPKPARSAWGSLTTLAHAEPSDESPELGNDLGL
jgi:hypothetical protein